MLTFQTVGYLGKLGLNSRILFINLLTKGNWPKGILLFSISKTDDKALRAVFIDEYERPASKRLVRKSKATDTGGLKPGFHMVVNMS